MIPIFPQHHIGTEIQKDSRKEGQGKVAYSADVYMACRPAGLDDEVPHLIVSNHGECHFSIVALSRHMCEIPAVAWGV